MYIPDSFLTVIPSLTSETSIKLPFGRYNNPQILRWIYINAGETDAGLELKLRLRRGAMTIDCILYDAALDADGNSNELHLVILPDDLAELLVVGVSAHASLALLFNFDVYLQGG